MAGYSGWSMSNNAVDAYKNGEKPLSKWTKSTIIQEIEKSGIPLYCSMDKLQNMPSKILKNICLYNSSWHHTSNHYNRTEFYSIDLDYVSQITDKRLDELVDEYKLDKKKAEPEEKWECAFLEWSGSRRHPKSTELVETGIVKGNWFHRTNGTKKKITANGFRFIKKVS